MEKKDAYIAFGVTGTDDLQDVRTAIEEKLFALKNDILQKYMVPTLLTKKMQNLQYLTLAEYVLLDGEIKQAETQELWSASPANRIDFIEQYESHISVLKLTLMNCTSFHQLMKIVQSFIITQDYYMVLFRMLFNEFSEALPEEVNTREIIDTGKLLLALKKEELDEKQTWEIELELARIDKIQKLKVS